MDPLRAYFEHLAPEWEAAQRPDRAVILDQLLAPFDALLQGCASLLEAGAGTGGMTRALIRRYPGIQIYALDLAHAMLHRAPHLNGQVRLVEADVHRLPFGDQSFTAILCHNSFPHFHSKDQALYEIKRVLRPAGRLFILHELSRLRVNAIHQNAQAEIIHQDLLPAGSDLHRLLEGAGFQILCLEDTGAHYAAAAQLQGAKPADDQDG